VLRFVVGRTGQMVASLWVATALLFLVVTVLPGDPVRALFGFQQPPPEVYDAIVAEYRLDQPLWRQYVLYLGDLLRGDLGRSFPRNPFGNARPTVEVTDVVAATAPVSARLVLLALVVQVLVGVVAGVLAARAGRRSGALVTAAAIVLVATPVVVAAYVLRTVVGVQLGWLPRGGLFDGPVSYVLPVLALAGLSTGYVVLLTRSEVRTALTTPFLRAARGRGIPEARLLAVHALRPSLVPVVAFVAANVGPTLVGLVVVEGVFDLPGLGGALLQAIRDRDRALMVGLVAVVMGVVIVATAVADVVTAWLDPRLRLDGRAE
jgi:oligopeptide transport system permease protein